MRLRLTALHLLAGLTLAASLFACSSSGGGSGGSGGGGTGSCPGDVDTTSVDTFFTTLACTYALKATNQGSASDTTFTQGKSYDVVIGADKTVKVPTDGGEIVFDYAGGGTYEDYPHEANAFLSADGWNLILQWSKAEESLLLVVTQGMASWKLDAGSSSTGGGFMCTPTDDPGGKACTTGGECEITCVCSKSQPGIGQCSGTCQSAADACNFICNVKGQGWTGMFCAKE